MLDDQLLGQLFTDTSLMQPCTEIHTKSTLGTNGDPSFRTNGQSPAPTWCDGTAQIPAIVTHTLRVVPGKVVARPANTSRCCPDASEQT